MSEWPTGRGDGRDADRIALDDEAVEDLDEALREAVDAVEAVEAAGQRRGRSEAAAPGDPTGAGGDGEEPVDSEAETAGLETMSSLRLELEELRQRSTRTLADFDNYRKRIDREKEAQQRYSGMEVLRGLLDIVDNLERALASDGPVDDLKTGVELTLRQAERLLDRHGVRRIEAEGMPFDPSLHEAVSRLEDRGVNEPKVTAVLQSGYLMHERLLRPVRVAVAVPVPAGGRPAGSDEGSQGGTEEG